MSQNKLKLLVISKTAPVSSKSSGTNRTYNLIKNLNCDLHLCYVDKKDKDELDIYKSVELIEKDINSLKNNRPSWIKSKIHKYKLAPHFILKHKYQEVLARRKQNLNEAIDKIKPEAIYINCINSFQYIDIEDLKKRKIPIITDFCDCISFLYNRKSGLETNYIKKLKYKLESISIRNYEKKVLKNSFLCIAISDIDIAELRKIYPHNNLKKIGLGIDFNYFKANRKEIKDKQIIFTGVMAYEPNHDAASYFTKEVFPLINDKHPESEFVIAGANPNAELLALKSNKVIVTGTVDDIRDSINNADIFVSPLRFGAGVKHKILTSWAMKIPVIATDISLEGIHAEDGVHYLRANTPKEYLEQINKVFNDEGLKNKLVEQAYEFVVKNHGWQAQSNNLKSLIQKAIKEFF